MRVEEWDVSRLKDQATDYRCARCKCVILKGRGFFFRPRNKTNWMVFCRKDCSELHIGPKGKALLSNEEWSVKLLQDAIKRTSKDVKRKET